MDKGRVLLIDDDRTFLEETKALLTEAGYEVSTCCNAVAFLHMIRVHKPSCVVLDINMPGLRGTEILTWIYRQKFDLRVIVCSGVDFDEDEFGNAHPFAILKKPFDIPDFIQKIDFAIDQPHKKAA